jgi:hypothetical protein
MQILDKWTPFRGWVHNLWVENCEEHRLYGGELLSPEHYWRQYRWWLRIAYRRQQAEQQRRERLQR